MTNILLFGKGYWGKIWYNTLLKGGHKFSVVDPTFAATFDENNIETYARLEEVRLKDFTHAIIVTPASTHVDIFRKINEVIPNKNILVEKPCGHGVGAFPALDGCFPGYLQLHTPAYTYIKEHIEDIGTPCLYKSIRASMGPRVRTDASILEDYMVHDLYIYMDLFGSYEDIDILSKTNVRRLTYSAIDTMFLRLFNPKTRVIADMFSSWWYPYKERRIIIMGDKGTFMWINDDLFFTSARYEWGAGNDNYGNFGDHLIPATETKIDLGTKTAVECELENLLSGNVKGGSYLLLHVWRLMHKVQTHTPFSY